MPEPARGDHHPCLPRKCAQKASSGRSRISRPNVILKASNRLKLCFGLSEWNSIKVRFQQISDPFAGLWGRFWSGVKNMWDINENIEAWNWAFDQPSLSSRKFLVEIFLIQFGQHFSDSELLSKWQRDYLCLSAIRAPRPMVVDQVLFQQRLQKWFSDSRIKSLNVWR